MREDWILVTLQKGENLMNATTLEFVKAAGGKIITHGPNNEDKINRSIKAIENYHLFIKTFTRHARNAEIMLLKNGCLGKFCKFRSDEGMSAKIMAINKAAFIGGARSAFIGPNGHPKTRGNGIERHIVDVTKIPKEKLFAAYGGLAFVTIVEHVLFLESHNISVPKFQASNIFDNKSGKPMIHNLVGTKPPSPSIPKADAEPAPVVVAVQSPVLVEKSVVSVSNLDLGSEFSAIRETVKTMANAGLLNDVIRKEINQMIFEKIIKRDFVEEILNNNF